MLVKTEVAGGVAQLTLDAPPLNILTREVLGEVRGALADLATRPDLRVLILKASGPNFSAGASVEEHLPDVVDEMLPEFMDTIRAVHHFPLPTICAIRGRCMGGGLELALACDLLIAADDALLGVPEIRLGVLPPAACGQLPARGSPGLAAEMIYTGAPIDAETAVQAGLLRRAVSDAHLDAAALEISAAIAVHSAAALRRAKRSLLASQDALDEAMTRASRIYLDDLMTTEDAKEGLRSFMEKRPPHWSHA